MIKFIPAHTTDGLSLLLEDEVCLRLNKENTFKCTNAGCSQSHTIVSVNMADQTTDMERYKIVSYCCEDFNSRLKKFLSH